MSDIITTLHPDTDESINLYPNIKKENIPNKGIDRTKLNDSINALLDSINQSELQVDTSAHILAFTTNKGVYVGSDTGLLYYWNGSNYIAGTSIVTLPLNETDLPSSIKTPLLKMASNIGNWEIGAIDINGVNVAQTNRIRSDFIKINNGTNIYFTDIFEGFIVLFDKYFNKLEHTNFDTSININNSSAYYVRFNIRKSDSSDFSQSDLTSALNNTYIYMIDNIFDYISKIIIDTEFNKNSLWEIGAINSTSGYFDANSTTRIRMKYGLKVNSNSFLYNPTNNLKIAIWEYDDAGEVINFVSFNTTKINTFTSNTKYIRVVIGYISNADIDESDVNTIQNSIKLYGDIDNSNPNLFFGERGFNFGDSIALGTDTTPYCDMVQMELGIKFSNYAVGGATMSTAHTPNINSQINQVIEGSRIPKYILLNGMTNDMQYATGLGTFSDSYTDTLDTDTFLGGMENILRQLKNAFPNCYILYIRCHNMASRDYDKQLEWGNKAIELCNKYAIPVVDVYKNGKMNTWFSYYLGTYTMAANDRTHPNYRGYAECYTPLIISKLKEIR